MCGECAVSKNFSSITYWNVQLCCLQNRSDEILQNLCSMLRKQWWSMGQNVYDKNYFV